MYKLIYNYSQEPALINKEKRNLKKECAWLIPILFLASFFFKPFGFNDYPFWFLVLASFNYSLGFSSSYFFFNLLVINNSKTNYSRAVHFLIQILITIHSFFLVTSFSFFFHAFLNTTQASPKTNILSYTLLRETFIYITLTTIVLNIVVFFLLKNKYVKKTFKKNSPNPLTTRNVKKRTVKTKAKQNENIILKGKNKEEVLEIKLCQFIYAKSHGHYIRIHFYNNSVYQTENNMKSIIIRSSMVALLEQLKDFPNVIARNHKSYIINILKISAIRTVGSSSRLVLNNLNISLPVSKGKEDFFKLKLNNSRV